MSIELNAPAEELARKLAEEVPYEKRLMGIKMSAMGGGNPVPLYGLAQAARFIHVGDYAEIALATRSATVGYIDPRMLASWISEVLGDEELAEGVRELIASGEVYGKVAMEIKALLQQRVDQVVAVLAPEDAEEVVDGPDAARAEAADAPAAAEAAKG